MDGLLTAQHGFMAQHSFWLSHVFNAHPLATLWDSNLVGRIFWVALPGWILMILKEHL
jgi:hypothetical protein